MPKVTEAHRARRREQILVAAARCFARDGFHATSMDTVIAEAGLSAGAVYGYFRGKDELIEAAAARAMELLDDLLPEMAAAASPAALIERLLTLVTQVSDQLGFDPTRIAVLAWGESVRNPRVREPVARAYAVVRTHLAEAVRRWQRDGRIAADADPAEVAKVLFGLLPGYIVQAQLIGDVRPDRYAAGLRALTGDRTGDPGTD